MVFKILMSLVFIFLLAIKIFSDEITIDNTTVLLALLIFAPWIIQYIKSLEINGLGRVEFINRAKRAELEKKAAKIASLAATGKDPTRHTFYNLRNDDPKLALAALRIEIEDKLHSIAAKEGLKTSQTEINQLTDELCDKQLLNHYETDVIQNLINLLNKAVHGQLKNYKTESLEWLIDIGLKLISSLEEKC